ncbi:MAG: hypothetical protein U0573_04910 [Phycisphaerales bacterium]|nr:hypothetical protein [Planctomycetota bacterium]
MAEPSTTTPRGAGAIAPGNRRQLPGPETALSEVFVSPRVVDRKTFEEYSLTLQQLIREASGHGRTLETTSLEVRTLRDNVQTLTRDLQSRVESATKLVPSLEQRIARAEQTADSVARLTSDPSRLEDLIRTNLASLVQQQVAEFETACTTALEKALARLAQRENDLDERAARIAADGDARLEHIERVRADAVLSLETRAREAETALKARIGELEELSREAERRAQQRFVDAAAREAAILERERQVQGKLDELIRGMEDRLAPLHEQVDYDVRELDKRLRRARLEVEAASGPGMQRLEQLCRQAASLLGPEDSAALGLPPPDAPDFPGLANVVERAARVHERLVTTAGELGTIEQQVDIARRSMDKAILEGADKIDLLFKQTDELVDTVGKSKDAAREIERIVEARIDQLRADAQAFHDYTTRLGERLLQLNQNAERLAGQINGSGDKSPRIAG